MKNYIIFNPFMKSNKEDVKNLANIIAGNAPGRTIYGATEPFSIQEVIINNSFPLELEIPEKTYITKK